MPVGGRKTKGGVPGAHIRVQVHHCSIPLYTGAMQVRTAQVHTPLQYNYKALPVQVQVPASVGKCVNQGREGTIICCLYNRSASTLASYRAPGTKRKILLIYSVRGL